MSRDYTPYQRKLISRWYSNLDSFKVQRLAELVTDIYLAETPRKRQGLWARVDKLLLDDKTPPEERAEVERILASEDVEALASLAAQRFAAGS
jgi:hypothetical protein